MKYKISYEWDVSHFKSGKRIYVKELCLGTKLTWLADGKIDDCDFFHLKTCRYIIKTTKELYKSIVKLKIEV